MGAKKHSLLSPSAASRWMGCPGSVRRIKRLIAKGTHVERRTSFFAAEGTAMHQVREDVLRFGFDLYDHFVGTVQGADGFEFLITEDMVDNLVEGIDRILEFDGDLLVETRVVTTEYVGPDEDGDDQGGTIDAAVISWPIKEVVMSDLKYGAGVAVQAVGNKQLRIYLLGLIAWLEATYPDVDFSDWTFRLIIDQPRHYEGGGEWKQSYQQLMAFGEEVREKAAQTKLIRPPICPSVDACTWCPVKDYDGECPEYEKANLDILGLEFEDLDAVEPLEMDDPEGITPKRRSFILKNWPVIKKWYERLHAGAITDALNGDDVPGLKAVYGRLPRRAHASEIESLAWLKKQGLATELCYTQKLLSPSQAEKALKRKANTFPKGLLAEAEPKPVLVPEEDERPSIPVDAEFDNLDADEFDDI